MCRIGHSRPTHNFISDEEVIPGVLDVILNMASNHILVERSDLAQVREKLYTVKIRFDLFDRIAGSAVIAYLKGSLMSKTLYCLLV